jgi:hypothetical protein
MAESGVPMSEISQYLGHTYTRVTERTYAVPTIWKAASALNRPSIQLRSSAR